LIGQADHGVRLPAPVSLVDGDIPMVFELAYVGREVALGESGGIHQEGGVGSIDDAQLGDESETCRRVNDRVDFRETVGRAVGRPPKRVSPQRRP